MLLQNQVRCKKCGDEPFSAHRHDFRSCKCGAISVDGGLDYLRRVGDISSSEELSIEISKEHYDKVLQSIQWAKETNRNEFGLICAIFRALRDCDLINRDL